MGDLTREQLWELIDALDSPNVNVQETVYAPRTSMLQVIQDAADAEFPDLEDDEPQEEEEGA